MNTSWRRAAILLILLISLDAWSFFQVLEHKPSDVPELDFLDVGQGDATLLKLPGVRILTDGGPDRKVLQSLEAVDAGTKHIDLVVISHPQLDHFNGIRYVLDKYSVGMVILNGRNDDPGVGEWPLFLAELKSKNVPILVLEEGDRIKIGDTHIDILGPNPTFKESGELNDTAVIERIVTPDWSALLAGDIGFAVEDFLQHKLSGVDILKVNHHGSRFSSGSSFLRAMHPQIAVISSGKDNHYGHPSPETLKRLEDQGVKVFRTDRSGSISIVRNNGNFRITSFGGGIPQQ
jgi:competence protein ComEC